MHRRRGRFGKVRPKWQRCTHLQSESWSRDHHQSERRQQHFWREKKDQSYSAQMQNHWSNETSLTKPTTVVVCSEGWGVVFVPGVVVVVLFGGRGAGVTWVTILVLSKIVFIDIEEWPEFLQLDKTYELISWTAHEMTKSYTSTSTLKSSWISISK